MGEQPERSRVWETSSIVAFAVVSQGVWEVLLTVLQPGFINGGPAGLIGNFIFTSGAMHLLILSLAEMTSMAPHAGCQFHWINVFAPRSIRTPLSFLVGLITAICQIAATASGPSLVGTLVQASIMKLWPQYTPSSRETLLIIIGVTGVIWAMSVKGARFLPNLQLYMFALHFFGGALFLVIFWKRSPKATVWHTLTSFTNGGGWSNDIIAWMVGQTSAVYAYSSTYSATTTAKLLRNADDVGFDAPMHIVDVTKNPARTIPKAMLIGHWVNGVFGGLFIVSFMLVMTDEKAALQDLTGFPHMWVLSQTLSPTWVAIVNLIPTILILAGTLDSNISTSLQIRAFASSGGLPYSRWIAEKDRQNGVAVHAATVTCVATVALSLLRLISVDAFDAIISLNVVCLMFTYACSIGVVLYSRIRRPELLRSRSFSLGRYGTAINFGGLLYSLHVLFWSTWPQSTPVALNDFNWASILFVGSLLLGMFYYIMKAQQRYASNIAQEDDETTARLISTVEG